MKENKQTNSKNLLYIIVIVLAIANFAFKLLNDIKIEQTSILFVGIPALITILLIKNAKTPKSAYGIVFKTITIFLLLSSVLLGEGLVCIIFMAPIFYAVAGIIVYIMESLKKLKKSNLNVFVLIPALFIISQGYEIKSNPEVLKVETLITIDKSSGFNNFNKVPNLIQDLPNFFKMGFPKPISIEGKGTEVGDFRKIQFKSDTKGIGTLFLEIKEKNENDLTFRVIEDNTHINHWLSFKEIKINIINNDDNTSTITWKTYFTCDLGPSWYFKPLEMYGVKLMNQHLIHSYFVK